jgi:pullulanase/glycogen debranching enzyme
MQIIDSLRYLVEEFHVDGFCFSNASALVTGPHGQELSRPVLVEDITFDPLLVSVKLVVNVCSPINGVCKVKKIIYKSLMLNFCNEY